MSIMTKFSLLPSTIPKQLKMKRLINFYYWLPVLLVVFCHNREVNEGEQFQPREIHEDIVFHFDKIEVDGIEYLILEKDNNNPHEGFGFMAFRANKLMEKQDSLLAHIRTMTELNVQILSALTDRPTEEVRNTTNKIFLDFLETENAELQSLEKHEFKNVLKEKN